MDELKKCPFCGWPAVLSTEIPKYYGRQAAFVKCTNNKCRAEGPMCNIHEVIFTEGGCRPLLRLKVFSAELMKLLKNGIKELHRGGKIWIFQKNTVIDSMI